MPSSNQGAIFRLIDANLNRSREALRVLEDYTRFVRNDAALSESLKSLRHELAEATHTLAARATHFRDTAGDVGTAISTPTETVREDLSHVVIAAGKRLGEALRSVEEYTKILDPAASKRVEAIRYRFYDIEAAIARSLQPNSSLTTRFRESRLYVLITESICTLPWQQVARLALEGGADVLQLREKQLDSGELLSRARELVALCREFNAISIINDRVDIAELSDADGVHLGQSDLRVADARKILGTEKLIGVSTHEIAHAQKAVSDGAHYIGVGPVFPSATKPRDFLPGLDYATRVAAEIDLPAVAIAGITLDNVEQVIRAGIPRIAVTAAVAASSDPRAAARSLKDKLKDAN